MPSIYSSCIHYSAHQDHQPDEITVGVLPYYKLASTRLYESYKHQISGRGHGTQRIQHVPDHQSQYAAAARLTDAPDAQFRPRQKRLGIDKAHITVVSSPQAAGFRELQRKHQHYLLSWDYSFLHYTLLIFLSHHFIRCSNQLCIHSSDVLVETGVHGQNTGFEGIGQSADNGCRNPVI
jgi:hypothetical protein